MCGRTRQHLHPWLDLSHHLVRPVLQVLPPWNSGPHVILWNAAVVCSITGSIQKCRLFILKRPFYKTEIVINSKSSSLDHTVGLLNGWSVGHNPPVGDICPARKQILNQCWILNVRLSATKLSNLHGKILIFVKCRASSGMPTPDELWPLDIKQNTDRGKIYNQMIFNIRTGRCTGS